MMIKRSTIAGLLAIVWMCIIFVFSSQAADESSEVSVGFSYRMVSSAGIFLHLPWDEEEFRKISNAIEGYIRKAAHMSEYAVLSVLLYIWLENWQFKAIRRSVIAAFLAMLYAVSDEFHQLFVQGRSGSVRDVMIDSAGALLGILVFVGVKECISFLWNRHKSREIGLS